MLWLHPYLHYWLGGTKFIFHLLKALKPYTDVHLGLCNGSPDIVKEFEKEGIKTHLFDITCMNTMKFWPFFNHYVNRTAEAIQKIVEEENIDHVIAGMFPLNVACQKAQIPYNQYIFEPFAFFWDKEMLRGYPFPKKFALKFLKLLHGKKDLEATKNAKKLFTFSEDVNQCIEDIYGRSATSTSLGVDVTPVRDSKYHKKFSPFFTFLHTTDFTPCKKTDFMVNAFEKLAKESEKARLVITIPIKAPKHIKKLKKTLEKKNLTEKVFIYNRIPEEDIGALISACNVAVYPGYSEGTGVSSVSMFVLECLAYGTPVIRTDTCKHEVLDHETGFLFKRGDEEDFLDKARFFLNHPGIRERMSEEAPRDMKRRFTWDIAAKNLWENIRIV